MKIWPVILRFAACAFAGGLLLGPGLAWLITSTWPSQADNVPLGLMLGFGGVIMGMVAGMFWTSRYERTHPW